MIRSLLIRLNLTACSKRETSCSKRATSRSLLKLWTGCNFNRVTGHARKLTQRIPRHGSVAVLAAALVMGIGTTVLPSGSATARVDAPIAQVDAGEPRYDPSNAPIVFLPGLLGSELQCGPIDVDEVNLWPGAADDALTWLPRFSGLGLINTMDGSGSISSRTQSSDDYPFGCGQQAYGPGQVAENEPTPKQPTWCVPEKRDDEEGPFETCPIDLASAAYNTFGYQLEAAASSGRPILMYAWDWRKDPADQVAQLANEITSLTSAKGVKVTVVAHSFGNSLFRALVERIESEGNDAGYFIGRFLGVASPWWGVSTAWEHGAFGEIQPGFASALLAERVGPQTVMDLFASSPGPYTLFPTPMFDDFVAKGSTTDGEHWLAAPVGGVSTWIAPDGVADIVAEQFDSCPDSSVFPCLSEDLYIEAADAMSSPGFDTSGIRDWVGIVGSGVDTALQICSDCTTWPDGSTDGQLITEDAGANSVTTHRIRMTDGDGNVPVFSAIQGTDPQAPPGDSIPFYFTCGIDHMGLMTDQGVLDQTIPYVLGTGDLSYGDTFQTNPNGTDACSSPIPTPSPSTTVVPAVPIIPVALPQTR